ncbi:MAG: FecR domain-containing protein [Alphaproteobacteria bacterium]|nr:FecR domain-containing protein [Alphaproteobacteria bacterium]
MSAEKTEETAAAWMAREDRGLTSEEQDALDLWLEQSSLNKVAYLRLKATWHRADRLAALKSMRPPPPERRVWLPRMVFAVAASLLLIAGGVIWLRPHQPPEQVYATTVGGLKEVRLVDGTRMELNTNTRVHANVTATGRTVTLDSGEAYFDVVHDARRPFTVYAGNRRITDLGTKFSVFRDGDDVRVTVREGRVRVDILKNTALDTPLVAEQGHQVITKGGETLVLAKPEQDIANDLSWRSGMLVFNQQTLSEAADQFNRYNTRHIVVEGNARKIRIGGSFKADNVDVFVLLLHRGFGLSVNEQGDRIVVSH